MKNKCLDLLESGLIGKHIGLVVIPYSLVDQIQ